jgi:hypothetical protein
MFHNPERVEQQRLATQIQPLQAMAAKLSCAIDAQGLATGTGFHT